jgi:nitrogen regulatory protein PII
MHFKLIIALVPDNLTDMVVDAAREAGATGSTVINQARGEGLEVSKTFLGLALEAQRDLVLLLVEEHLSRSILENIEKAADFSNIKNGGIAFQIDVEDAVGVNHQIEALSKVVEDEL